LSMSTWIRRLGIGLMNWVWFISVDAPVEEWRRYSILLRVLIIDTLLVRWL
jgi:hypothetical protein